MNASMRSTTRIRLAACWLAALAALALAGCGGAAVQAALSEPSTNATGSTYAPDLQAAQNVQSVLQQSAVRDVGGATGP
jgi:hypothetical protein